MADLVLHLGGEGELAATRKVRPPEPYNGKGIRYLNERIQKKAGKSFASGG